MSIRAVVRAFITNWNMEYRWDNTDIEVELRVVRTAASPHPVFTRAVLTVDRETFKACGFDRLMNDHASIKMTMEVEDAPLRKGMSVKLVDRGPIDAAAKRAAQLAGFPCAYAPNVAVGEGGVIVKSEGEVDPGEPGLAECRFANCTVIVDRSMVRPG